ncbi:DUF4282 domain-containing protein [Escherichia coli]|uniref:DUF4282 domain-containing protein n=1 Tax=Escherichia coli TaxID=562 RepID=UPI00201A21C1|nr:DUF4282 domain-containing protein [Escherichia coli]MCN1991387.1 DUF4282 domain-containing protein [Escherichia coli]MCN2748530.1 DUF4282 domain-containing protein [Escherichia coli]MCN3565879.1 DUF4282 domain-containing protein [Escherichia coli]MCN5582766.1 DUF4282 domain-containing protein [Escherichia coli]MCN5790515.1 DUF4282 domain-containing protein [Escherichia coli]
MFGFDKLITPKIINVLYGITMLLLVVAAIITFVNGKAAGALVLLCFCYVLYFAEYSLSASWFHLKTMSIFAE